MNILMLSSSQYLDTGYLTHAQSMIEEHLTSVDELLFIPYAGVTVSWDDYLTKVQQALPDISIKGIHDFNDPIGAVRQAQAVAVGGGNTFNLLHTLYQNKLIEVIRERVSCGMPYIGWSAGSNICGNSIRTTNDMPIIQPESFDALQLVPFQLNPHYSDYQPPGHNGETRAERLAEFITLNPTMPVVGIREGAALKYEGEKLTLIGEAGGLILTQSDTKNIEIGQDISHLLMA
ncbi:dipeptidase PepE [Alteromonadaceae bacterium M269]|nr:dipeptidase PepE [Alteromonadaceae bacterium M269]